MKNSFREFEVLVMSGMAIFIVNFREVYKQDAMSRWYCCNDADVTPSRLQEVRSEKA